MGHAPFPPLPTVIGARPQVTASAEAEAVNFTQSTLLKIVHRGTKKPWWFRTDQGFGSWSGGFVLSALQNGFPERLNA